MPSTVSRFFHSFSEKLKQYQTVILLSLVYIIGIGLTAVVAKLFKTSFLQSKTQKNSSWLQKKPTFLDEKMY